MGRDVAVYQSAPAHGSSILRLVLRDETVDHHPHRSQRWPGTIMRRRHGRVHEPAPGLLVLGI